MLVICYFYFISYEFLFSTNQFYFTRLIPQLIIGNNSLRAIYLLEKVRSRSNISKIFRKLEEFSSMM